MQEAFPVRDPAPIRVRSCKYVLQYVTMLSMRRSGPPTTEPITVEMSLRTMDTVQKKRERNPCQVPNTHDFDCRCRSKGLDYVDECDTKAQSTLIHSTV